MRCGATFVCYLKCRLKFNCKNKDPIWKEHEETGDDLLVEKNTLKHDDACIGYVTEKKRSMIKC